MELNNFDTLDRHPLHHEPVTDSNDWRVPQDDDSWNDSGAAKLAGDTIIVIELPCSKTDGKQLKSISPLSIEPGNDGAGSSSPDYLELGLFAIIVFAVAIAILRD